MLCAAVWSCCNTNIEQKSSSLTCHLWRVHSPVVKWHPQQCCGFLLCTRWWGHILLGVISSGTLNQRWDLEHPALDFCGLCRPLRFAPKACLWTLWVFLLWLVFLVWSCYISVGLDIIFYWKMPVACHVELLRLLAVTWNCLCISQILVHNQDRPR